MSSPRPPSLDQLLDLLPELEELVPLRMALVESADVDPDYRWSASGEYRLLETRVVDPERLRAAIPALAAEAAARAERVYGLIVEAMTTLGEGSHAAAALALIHAGEIEEEVGRTEAARQLYLKARDVGRRGRDRSGEGLALRRLARLARASGTLQRAELLYRESLSIAEAQDDTVAIISACQGMGNVMGDQERWGDADMWYRRGLQAFTGRLPDHLLWQLQVNLSVVARKQGDLAQSRTWLEDARSTAGDSRDSSAPFIRNAEGLLLQAEGDPSAAEAVFRTALLESAKPAEQATFLVNLADTLIEQGRLAEARSICRDLEEVAAAGRLNAFLPYVYRTMGRIATIERDEDGFVFFEQALALSSAPVPSLHDEALTQRDYARFEAALGRFDAAIARLEIAETIYDRIGADTPASAISLERAALATRTPSIEDVTPEKS